ncbi:MAG: hypothetical protein Q8Q62_20115 [Mesorhizobium sp.]|nr:hypothetical protein [Mesorhizobium sp.]
MTLNLTAAPVSDLDILVQSLSDIAFPVSVEGATDSYDISEPVPLFTIDTAAAARDIALSAATQVGWRYLLTDGPEVATADLDLASGAGGGGARFNNLTRGSIALNFKEALNVAGKLAASTDAVYELRILEVPALNMGAVWLERTDGSLFVPYLDAARLSGEPPAPDAAFPNELSRQASIRMGELPHRKDAQGAN